MNGFQKFSVVLALIVSSAAIAQEEVCMEFSKSDLSSMLDRTQTSFEDAKFPVAYRLLDEVYRELRCLGGVVPVDDLTRFAGMYSVVSFMDQDEVAAIRWGHLRKQIGASQGWSIARPKAYREMMSSAPSPLFAGPENMAIAHTKKSAVLMNGQVLEAPSYWVEVPGFVQTINKKGIVTDAHWQDGVAFHSDLLVPAPGKAAPGWALKLAAPARPVGTVAASETGTDEQTETAPEGIEEKEAGWISNADPKEWMPDCPWAGESVVATASREIVTVNKVEYRVITTSEQNKFSTVLENCHEYRAQRRFKRWRKAVNDTENLQRNNTISAESLIRLIGSAATAVGAEVYRDSMLRALVREETPQAETDEGK